MSNITLLVFFFFALVILNRETNVINSVSLRLHISFLFSMPVLCVRVHSGEHDSRVAEVLAPLAPAWLWRCARAPVACERF